MLIFECDSCGRKIRDKRLIYRIGFYSPVSVEMSESGADELDITEGFHIMQVVDNNEMVREEILDRDFYLCPKCAEGFMRYVHCDNDNNISFRSIAPNT